MGVFPLVFSDVYRDNCMNRSHLRDIYRTFTACLQVVFGALPQSEREEILQLGTAQMPLAPDLDLTAMAESMR